MTQLAARSILDSSRQRSRVCLSGAAGAVFPASLIFFGARDASERTHLCTDTIEPYYCFWNLPAESTLAFLMSRSASVHLSAALSGLNINQSDCCSISEEHVRKCALQASTSIGIWLVSITRRRLCRLLRVEAVQQAHELRALQAAVLDHDSQRGCKDVKLTQSHQPRR